MGLMERLAATKRQPDTLVPDDFETSVNSQGQRSESATFTADTGTFIRQGREHPFRVAVPAYQGETTNGTAGDTETFTLTHSVTDTPVTQSVVCWIGGTYYGTPDAVDYTNDTIDVTDDGTGNNLHIYYVSDAAATIEVRKSVPASTSASDQQLYTGNLGLVHETKQVEQPQYFDTDETPFHPWVGADMTITVYLEAPYTVRWTDPDGDGTEPTNALLNVPVQRGQSETAGLTSAIKKDMGRA